MGCVCVGGGGVGMCGCVCEGGVGCWEGREGTYVSESGCRGCFFCVVNLRGFPKSQVVFMF